MRVPVYLCTCAYYNHVIFLYNESVQNNRLTAAVGVKKTKGSRLGVFLPLHTPDVATYAAHRLLQTYSGPATPLTDLLKIRECVWCDAPGILSS